jgi:hypothetical protein
MENQYNIDEIFRSDNDVSASPHIVNNDFVKKNYRHQDIPPVK